MSGSGRLHIVLSFPLKLLWCEDWDEWYNICNLDEVAKVPKLSFWNVLGLRSLSSCPSLLMKPRTDFSLPFAPKRSHFYWRESICIQTHVDFVTDCLTFLCYTPAWRWWMCVYLLPADLNLQTLCRDRCFISVLRQIHFSSQQTALFLEIQPFPLPPSPLSDGCNRHPQSTNWITLDFTTKIPNNVPFEASRCVSWGAAKASGFAPLLLESEAGFR